MVRSTEHAEMTAHEPETREAHIPTRTTTQEQAIALVQPEDSRARMEPGRRSRMGRGRQQGAPRPRGNEDQSSGVPPARAQEGQLATHGSGSETGARAKLPEPRALRSPYLPLQSCHPHPGPSLATVTLFPFFQNTTCFLGTPVSTFYALCLEMLLPALFCLLTILIL